MSHDCSDPAETDKDFVARGFEWIERLIYIAIGALLGIIAIVFLAYGVIDFILTFSLAHFTVDIVTLLGRLLLVLLIVELLYTVKISYSVGTLVLEPFLYVGLIAAVRRIFVLTAEFSEAKGTQAIDFNHFVIELGALSGLILVIAVALWLLRRSEAYVRPSHRERERSETL